MSDKNREFPQYRRLSNGLRLYKIMDDRNFEEIQIMGSKRTLFVHKATQYPEIILIREMLDCHPPYEMSSSEEYGA